MKIGQTFRSRSLKLYVSGPTMRAETSILADKGLVFVSVLLGAEPADTKEDDSRLVDPHAVLRELGWEERLPSGEPGWYWALYDNDEEGIEDKVGIIRCIRGDWMMDDPKGDIVPANEQITVKILGPRVFEWSPEKKTAPDTPEPPPATLPQDAQPPVKPVKAHVPQEVQPLVKRAKKSSKKPVKTAKHPSKKTPAKGRKK